MSIEGPNKSTASLPSIKEPGSSDPLVATRAEKEKKLRERLGQLATLPEDEWFREWISHRVDDEVADVEIENFFKNVAKSSTVGSVLKEDFSILPFLFDQLCSKIYDSSENIDVLIHNVKERMGETMKNDEEVTQRIRTNPVATDTEYRLGTYKEGLESQVRDAVFTFYEKGYSPMESGFNDLALGTQYMGFNTAPSDASTIESNLNTIVDLGNSLNEHIHHIEVAVSSDRVQIIITPKNKTLPLAKWQSIWTSVASAVPRIEVRDPFRVSESGEGAIYFREAQDRLRAGKNTWLRQGYAFIDGKVTEISYKDFKKLVSK